MTGFININRHLTTLFATSFLIVLEGCGAIPPSSAPWFRSEVLPPLEGQVLDVDSGEPIKGAIVLIKWETYAGHSHWICPHVVTAVADENGHFKSSGWDGWKEAIRTTRERAVVYKPGYEMLKDAEGEAVWYLKRSEMSVQERLDYLVSLSERTRCAEGRKSNYNRYAYARAVYEEAKGLRTSGNEENISTILWLKRVAATAFIAKDGPLSAEEYERRIEEIYKGEFQ